MMGEQKRLVGIDIFRALAIFAVIIVHIDQGVKVLPPSWSLITNFAAFCVPFFLATAFYLAINKLYESQGLYPLRSRFAHLLIPYAAWSAFYLLYKTAKYIAGGESSRLLGLFQDPLSLVFFGGVSYHLYFIPLLTIGTLLIKLVEILIRSKISLKSIGVIALLSLLVYEEVLFSGNGLKAPANIAFEPLLAAVFPGGNSNPPVRLFFVALVWALRCLPYIMVAMLLAHPAVHKFRTQLIEKYPVFWMLIFLAVNIFGAGLPDGVEEIARGYTAIIAAISISSVLKENSLISNIGLCSYGIYLIHMFFVEIFQSVAIRLNPDYVNSVSTALLLLASLMILLVSWATIILLMKIKGLSQIL